LLSKKNPNKGIRTIPNAYIYVYLVFLPPNADIEAKMTQMLIFTNHSPSKAKYLNLNKITDFVAKNGFLF